MMRISASNIAWSPADDAAVSLLLAKHGVDAIDIAPSKYFTDLASVPKEKIADVRHWWADKGIEIIGMQALLFGTQGLNIFGELPIRDRMLTYLTHVCRIAQGLGVRFLVFGSPKNRDRSNIDDCATKDIAYDFFHKLGCIASDHNVVICLEPNPPVYGANFMTDTASTVEVVRAVDHPSIRMQLDIGALALNGENVMDVLASHAKLVGHIHASEPELKVLGDCSTDHHSASIAIRRFCPEHIVTIEMREESKAPLVCLDRALTFARHCYG